MDSTRRLNTICGRLVVALVLVLPWLDGMGGSATYGEEKTRQVPGQRLPTAPGDARLVEKHALMHRVAGVGDYRIELENFDAENAAGGYMTVRIFNEVGGLDFFELSHPPLAKGVRPITVRSGQSDLMFVMYRLDYDARNPLGIRVYSIDRAAQVRAELRLWSGRLGYTTNLSDIVGDLDKDGRIEILNYGIREPGTGVPIPGGTAYLGPLIIYQYVAVGDATNVTPAFQRVKGRSFEKQYLEHAEWLINTQYPEMLKTGQHRAAETAVLSWLATVESAQNSDRIQEALKKLGKLPYPSASRKSELVELLVRDGYSLLARGRP